MLWAELVFAQLPSPLQQAATKVLREMPAKLYEGRATEADVQACLKLIELAPNGDAKRPFALLVAQYHRIALQKHERVREHRDFLKEQKTLLEGKQFYILL